MMLRSQRQTMRELLLYDIPEKDEQNWEAKNNEADYYLSHEDLAHLSAEKTAIQLKDTLLAAHYRLLCFNPTRLEADQEVHFWPPGCESDEDVLEKIDRVRKDDRLDEKIKLLVELDRFEQWRQVENKDKYQQFKLSQALWAGWYDYAHAREPREDDWFIVFPENKKEGVE